MVVLNILSSLPGYRLPSILLMVRFGGWKEFFQPFQEVQELPIHITAYGCQVLLSGVMADLSQVILYMACGYFKTVFGLFIVNSHLFFLCFLSCPIRVRHEYVRVSLYGIVLDVRSSYFLKALPIAVQIFKSALYR